MAENQRTPRPNVVQVHVVIGIKDVGAVRARDKKRIPTHSFPSTHGTIDAARNSLLCAPVQHV